MKSATTSIASIEKQKLCNFYTKGDLNFNPTLLYKGVLQDKNTLAWNDSMNSSISYFIKDYSLKLYIILIIFFYLFSSGFVIAGTGDKVTVSGGATSGAGANGDYFYAGTTNVGGTDRAYYDMPSSVYRIEYRYNSGYGVTEWEVWESTARSGSGIVRFYKSNSSVTIPTGAWSVDIASGSPVITFTAAPVAPTVTTQAVSSISTTTATGNGNITSLGSPNPTAYGICWNTTGTPTTSDSKNDIGAASATGAFTASMASLTAGTLYYVRAFATNTAGTVYGGQVTFTALKVPTVTTQAVTSISVTTATGNGNITDLGVPNPTAHGVCWNTSTGPTISNSKVDNGVASSTGVFTASMTSLTGGTPYFVRAFATNSTGTVYGTEVTFTTLTNGTWTGTTNTIWGTATNWAGGSVPTSATDVTIPSGLTNYPTISATTSADCNNLTVISGGSLTIESSASGTGSLIVSGTPTGDVTCQRYMTGGKWHLVSPVAAGGSISTFVQAAGNAISSKDVSGTLNYGMMDYNETPNLWNSYFTTATPGNYVAGKGYSLRRTGDGIATFTGTLTSGTKTVALTKVGTEGWNCVGNPYTSAINMNTAASASNNFLKTNAIDASNLDPSYACLYVWDDAIAAYKITGNISYGGRDLAQNIFAPGQGFFVKANNSSSSVQFTAAMQAHQPATELKSGQVSWPGFELTATSGLIKASTVVAFDNAMTRGLDPTYDAGLLRGSSGLSVYTRLLADNGIDFAIQCLPKTYDNLVIPVGVDYKTGGEITFSIQTIELPSTVNIKLEDKTKGTFTSLTDKSTLKATIAAGANGIGRFYIHVNGIVSSSPLTSLSSGIKAYVENGSIVIIGEVSSSAKAYINDINGRILGTFNLKTGSRNTIPAVGLISGVYLITINDGNKRVVIKIVNY